MNKLHLIAAVGLCLIVAALALPFPSWLFWPLVLVGLGGIAFVIGFVVKWSLRPLVHLVAIRRHPNEAYEFFASQPDAWVVFNVTNDAIRADDLPADSSLSGGRLMGPFEFDVPQLNGRSVTVYGKSQRCFELLDAFARKVRRTKQKNLPGQQKPERDK